MEWTDQQLAELAREYARVGYVRGDLWPAPPDKFTAADILDSFRRIPDSAGKDGYIAELAKTARS